MLKHWFRENKAEIIFIALFFSCAAAAYLFYTAFVPQFIRILYANKPLIYAERYIVIVNEYVSLFVAYFFISIWALLGFLICSLFKNKKQISNLFFYIFVFINTFPKIGGPIELNLDNSWIYGINYAFAHNFQFGKDIVFTYGPLGFLAYPQAIGNNLLIGLFFNILTHLVLVISLVGLIIFIHGKDTKPRWTLYSVTAIAMINLSRINQLTGGMMFVILITALLLNYHARKSFIFLIGAVFYIAIILLTKFSWGITCASILFSCLLTTSIKNRKYGLFIYSSGLLGIAFFFVWFLIYGNFNNIINYVVTNYQCIAGYSSAMALYPQNNWVLIALAVAGVLFLIFYLNDGEIYKLSCLLFVAPFLIFKHSFVRQDSVHAISFFTFLFIYFFFVLIFTHSFKKILIVCGIGFLSLLLVYVNILTCRIFLFPAKICSKAENVLNVIRYDSYRNKLSRISAENLKEQVLSKDMLDQIKQETVDVYPWDTTYIAANNLNWLPRPIFQSQAVYTPWLDKLNYDFFSRNNIPAFIVWVKKSFMEGVDGAYLLNQDPQTVHQLFDRYEPVSYDSRVILFKRKDWPTFKSRKILGVTESCWNDFEKVPESKNSVITARVSVERTLFGKIKRLFYKEDGVFIEYKLSSGKSVKHRLVVDNAVSGVWVQPYLTDILPGAQDKNIHNENYLFFGETVTHIKLSYNGKGSFKPYFKLTWEEYQL